MSYGSIPLEKRLTENIRNYNLKLLYPFDLLQEYIKSIGKIMNLNILLTERHGEKAVSYGNCAGFQPDVVNNPGLKIKIQNRTVGHLYLIQDDSELNQEVRHFIDQMVTFLEKMGEEAYQRREMAIYLDEIDAKSQKSIPNIGFGEKEDALTGLYNKTYFENRMRIIDRAEVFPVAMIYGNINDWMLFNTLYGEEESSRLIQIVADIMLEEARPDYVIGRLDGDLLCVLIPMVEAGEAQAYCENVKKKCESYQDEILAPSIAFGIVEKTNVEEKLADLISDAEYEMLQDKMEMKTKEDYLKRMEKYK